MREPFRLELDFRRALSLYVYLQASETELPDAVSAFFAELRAYLYERLSIEEMERPEELLKRMGRES